MSSGAKFVKKMMQDKPYRMRWLQAVARGITRTPPALNVADFRMMKDFLVKEAVTLDPRMPVQAVEGKPYDLMECDLSARISVKIQQAIFPRPRLRGQGMTKMQPLVLKNSMNEKDRGGPYIPEWDVLIAVQPSDPSVGQKFVMAIMNADHFLHNPELIQRTNHNVKLRAERAKWDGAWGLSVMPPQPMMDMQNEIVMRTIGHGGTLWKELLG